MNVCVCLYTYTYIKCLCVCFFVGVSVCVCRHACTHVVVHVCMYECLFVCMYIHTNIQTYAYTNIYIDTGMCIYKHIYTINICKYMEICISKACIHVFIRMCVSMFVFMPERVLYVSYTKSPEFRSSLAVSAAWMAVDARRAVILGVYYEACSHPQSLGPRTSSTGRYQLNWLSGACKRRRLAQMNSVPVSPPEPYTPRKDPSRFGSSYGPPAEDTQDGSPLLRSDRS